MFILISSPLFHVMQSRISSDTELKAFPWPFSLLSFNGYEGPYTWLNSRSLLAQYA